MALFSGSFKGYFSPAATASGGGATYAFIGQTEDGFHKETQLHHGKIVSDEGGDSTIDETQRGSDTSVRLTWIEYDKIKAVMAAHNPLGKVYENVGKLMSALAGPLVLVPAPGTPAEAEVGVGNCYLFYKSYPATNYEDLLSSNHRKGPLTFRTLPDETNARKVWEVVAKPSGIP